MKRWILALLLCSITLQAEETTGEGAGYATRDATALSMVGWGATLCVGIAALVVLIPNHASTSH